MFGLLLCLFDSFDSLFGFFVSLRRCGQVVNSGRFREVVVCLEEQEGIDRVSRPLLVALLNMATKSSTSTEIHSTGETSVLERIAEKHLQQSKILVSEDAPMELQFNHGQCRYLVKKLDMAVQIARKSNNLSVRNLKLLVRLAMDVESFVQECCEKKHWIQAACILLNAFEYVALLSSHLELCIWSFNNSARTILATRLRRELTTISEVQDRRLLDEVTLLSKVEAALSLESLSNLQARQLATCLLRILQAFLTDNPITEYANLAELSFCDRVNMFSKVEAALSSGIVTNPEVVQLATSLAERFIASVIGPVSDEPLKGYMRVGGANLKREKLLGKGSFGEVYKVKWLNMPAAEKTLPDTNQGKLSDLDREVSILARQSHPHIVRLLCYVKEGLKCSIVQELMDSTLSKLIEDRLVWYRTRENPSGSPFSTDEIIDILHQIAEGMRYLHRKKILHRDLKPENILVKCKKLAKVDGQFVYAKVADFGISKTKERSITLCHPTWNIGTTRWMAPELIHLGPHVSTCQTGDWYPDWTPSKSDVYSFGMVCYTILTGNLPFVNDSQADLKAKVLDDKRPPLLPVYPFCLRSMIQKCWRPEPAERPTFAEICRELTFMRGSLLIGWDL